MEVGFGAISALWESHEKSVRHRHESSGQERPCGTPYRSVAGGRLRPWQVRDRLFTPRGRHGVDAAEVRAFLDRVADDLAACYAEVAATHERADRIRDALREWQSEQARRALASIR
ncbi:DivIVA domain-containing protein [Micromonospora yangpuensis]|uniref:DivIVA domain-containing protein n=1 Tax=Micromonospora yangpuensis TaxID=683228 RepID=A0A1C6UAY5_9ACTN|nr:DivIVA domain-containing protein [Micromonospora yangpuensis]